MPGMPGSFGRFSGPFAMHDEARAHPIAAVRRDDPARAASSQRISVTSVWKQRVAVEVELPRRSRGCARGSRARGEYFSRRDVAELFEQRQVDVRLDVARAPGIAVPVPGAAEVAALLDDADVLDAGLAQPRAGEQAAEAAADHDDVDLVGERRAREAGLDVRIVDEVREVALDLDVLLVAVVRAALVALVAVLLAQRVGIEAAARRIVRGGGARASVSVVMSCSCLLAVKPAPVVRRVRESRPTSLPRPSGGRAQRLGAKSTLGPPGTYQDSSGRGCAVLPRSAVATSDSGEPRDAGLAP